MEGIQNINGLYTGYPKNIEEEDNSLLGTL
jgi:hypothetical protein